METLKSAELAGQCGVNLQTLRYYEREGLLPAPPRTAAGYRSFPPESVARVQFIKHAQALGFTLKEVKELLALRVDPRSTCAEVRDRALAKVSDIEQKIQSLQAIQAALMRLAATCSGEGPASDCSLLEALEGEVSDAMGENEQRPPRSRCTD